MLYYTAFFTSKDIAAQLAVETIVPEAAIVTGEFNLCPDDLLASAGSGDPVYIAADLILRDHFTIGHICHMITGRDPLGGYSAILAGFCNIVAFFTAGCAFHKPQRIDFHVTHLDTGGNNIQQRGSVLQIIGIHPEGLVATGTDLFPFSVAVSPKDTAAGTTLDLITLAAFHEVPAAGFRVKAHVTLLTAGAAIDDQGASAHAVLGKIIDLLIVLLMVIVFPRVVFPALRAGHIRDHTVFTALTPQLIAIFPAMGCAGSLSDCHQRILSGNGKGIGNG